MDCIADVIRVVFVGAGRGHVLITGTPDLPTGILFFFLSQGGMVKIPLTGMGVDLHQKVGGGQNWKIIGSKNLVF